MNKFRADFLRTPCEHSLILLRLVLRYYTTSSNNGTSIYPVTSPFARTTHSHLLGNQVRQHLRTALEDKLDLKENHSVRKICPPNTSSLVGLHRRHQQNTVDRLQYKLKFQRDSCPLFEAEAGGKNLRTRSFTTEETE